MLKRRCTSRPDLAGLALTGLVLAGLTYNTLAIGAVSHAQVAAQLGPRPFFLTEAMTDSPLKSRLQQCQGQVFYPNKLSIGHRGAPLQFPEHTRESYIAAAKMGAGMLECDVTFTQDKALVCRHSQNDLHTTTNILAVPELAKKCTTPPDYTRDKPFKHVECRTSDITLEEFLSLKGKMDAGNPDARTLEEYMNATATYRTDLYASEGTLMSHKQSIELFRTLGVKMIPELKTPVVPMPYQGDFSQQDYAQQMIDEYKAMNIPATDVYPQSFRLSDIQYWLAHEPEFAQQAVYLDGRYRDKHFDTDQPESWTPSMTALKAQGVNIIAPPLWMLVTLDKPSTASGLSSEPERPLPESERSLPEIIPSQYASAAQQAGLEMMTWTLERSGPLNNGDGWYYRSVSEAIHNDGDLYTLLDVLVQDVGVTGVFSDWPATVTYYAGCIGTPAGSR